jgi:hypothetical protein
VVNGTASFHSRQKRATVLFGSFDRGSARPAPGALLLFGFTGAPFGTGGSELVALQIEDFTAVSSGLRLCLRCSKTDQVEQETELDLPHGRSTETCPVRAFEAWQVVAKRQAEPLFRKNSAIGRQTARGRRGRGDGGAVAGPRY